MLIMSNKPFHGLILSRPLRHRKTFLFMLVHVFLFAVHNSAYGQPCWAEYKNVIDNRGESRNARLQIQANPSCQTLSRLLRASEDYLRVHDAFNSCLSVYGATPGPIEDKEIYERLILNLHRDVAKYCR
mgnify:CR=1 FL=1